MSAEGGQVEEERGGILSWFAGAIETRRVKFALGLLIVISVLPYPEIETRLREVFLFAFGFEFLVRVALLVSGRTERTRTEYFFLVIDIIALASFLPLERVLGEHQRFVLRTLRLLRLLLLLRFSRALAHDVYSVLTRREQLQQFGLVTIAVLSLSFVSAVFLANLTIPHDYVGINTGAVSEAQAFWDRMWWAFRQVESPDNLVSNLRVHPFLGVLSLILTIVGIFVFSYLIGIGTNVVEQVVRAERRRAIDYQRHTVVIGRPKVTELLVKEFVNIHEKNRTLRRIRPRQIFRWLFRGGPRPRRHAFPRIAIIGEKELPPSYLYGRGMRWVVHRQGDPVQAEALGLVAAHAAKRAVFLTRGEPGGDATTIARVAAFRQENPDAQLFVEVIDSENLPLCRAVGGPGTFPLDVSRFLGLFLCHHLIVPGMEEIARELLSADGCEFYTHVFVDPREQRALRARHGERIRFSTLAEWAYREHQVVLVGALVGAPVSRRLGLVPVDELEAWVNPHDEPAPGQTEFVDAMIDLRSLQGVIGIAETYVPVREFAQRMLKPARSAPPAADVASVTNALRPRDPELSRIAVVGYSPALAWLIGGLARFVKNVTVEVFLPQDQRDGARLHERLSRLSVGVSHEDPLPGTRGVTRELEQGGSVTLYSAPRAELSRTVASRLNAALDDGAAYDAVVFLADPDVPDPDATTSLACLRAVRGVKGRVPHVLAEMVSARQGQRLKAQLAKCGHADVEVTTVGTKQIESYFMVHSAFVPGVTEIYDRLLGSIGQEILRLTFDEGATGSFGFGDLIPPLAARGCIPMSIELANGELITSPPPGRRFAVEQVSAVFVLGDRDRANLPVTAFGSEEE